MKQGIFTKQFDYHGTPVEAFIRWETNRDKHTTLNETRYFYKTI
nr:MAG TPA: hypothetical protein [Caudoviricetes sp.]